MIQIIVATRILVFDFELFIGGRFTIFDEFARAVRAVHHNQTYLCPKIKDSNILFIIANDSLISPPFGPKPRPALCVLVEPFGTGDYENDKSRQVPGHLASGFGHFADIRNLRTWREFR